MPRCSSCRRRRKVDEIGLCKECREGPDVGRADPGRRRSGPRPPRPDPARPRSPGSSGVRRAPAATSTSRATASARMTAAPSHAPPPGRGRRLEGSRPGGTALHRDRTDQEASLETMSGRGEESSFVSRPGDERVTGKSLLCRACGETLGYRTAVTDLRHHGDQLRLCTSNASRNCTGASSSSGRIPLTSRAGRARCPDSVREAEEDRLLTAEFDDDPVLLRRSA